jgi:hypothetical protein
VPLAGEVDTLVINCLVYHGTVGAFSHCPGVQEREIASFVLYYNNERYHEALDNATPADAYYCRAHELLANRERTKKRTM